MSYKRTTNGLRISVLGIAIMLLSCSYLFGQDDKDNHIKISILVEDIDAVPIPGATVKLMENNNVIETEKSNSFGVVQFVGDYNKYYVVEISKQGMVTKRVAYDTKVPEGTEGIFGIEGPIFLFEGCEGVETSVMDDPVVIIKFNSRRRDFDPDESYAARMGAKISGLMANIEDCKLQAYRDLIDKADDLYKKKQYDDALDTYKEALNEKPGDNYANKKIAEINQIQARENQNDRLYDVNIKEGDKYFNAGNYTLAKNFYKRSLTYKPGAEYPTIKIAEIDRLLSQKDQNKQQELQQAEQHAKDEAYNKLIAQGDQYLNNKNYNGAKSIYNQALNLKPGDPYPTNKIAEIDRILSQQQQQANETQAKKDCYDKAVAQGDQYYKVKNYNAAKVAYQNALNCLPTEPYPKTKLAEINQIEAQQQQLATQQQAKDDCYTQNVTQGDQYYNAKNYEAAKNAYQKALSCKPDETYPKAKLAEIDRIETQQQQLAAEEQRIQQAKEDCYKDAIAKGDQYFNAKNYEAAKSEYQKALRCKPVETYPNTKLAQINQIEAQQQQLAAQEKAKEDCYQRALAQGQQYYNAKNYEAARKAYQDAQNCKPTETYPKTKIAEINQLQAQQLQLATQEKAKEDCYQRAVAQGQQYYNARNYEAAKQAYQDALNCKPNESLPKTKIAEINQLQVQQQKLAAEAQAKEDCYQKAIAQGQQYYNVKNYQAAKSAYQDALNCKPSESYPKKKIAEIDRVLAQQEADKLYQQVIANADKLYNNKDYEAAKTEYKKALQIKTGENYPQQRITAIDNIIQQQQAAELAEKQKKREFDKLVTLADTYFNKKDYQNAKKTYNKALTVFPNAPHPKQRLRDIDDLLKQQALAPPTVKKGSALAELKFVNKDEEQKYLNELKKKYPEGITLEIYNEQRRTVKRYIVIRGGMANEYRVAQYSWGAEYSINGRDITSQYFNQQTEVREGEYFKSFEIQQ